MDRWMKEGEKREEMIDGRKERERKGREMINKVKGGREEGIDK